MPDLSATIWTVVRNKLKAESTVLTCGAVRLDPYTFHHAEILVREVTGETTRGWTTAQVKVRNYDGGAQITLSNGVPNAQTGLVLDTTDLTAAANNSAGRRGLVQVLDVDSFGTLRGEIRTVPATELQVVLTRDAVVGLGKYDVFVTVFTDARIAAPYASDKTDVSAGAT